jgi:hypothetical protein
LHLSVFMILSICKTLRNRPFNLKGGLWFFVSFRIFFSDNTKSSNIFFCRAKREICSQNLTLGYMTKTLNHIILFSSTKIRIFFSATLGIRIFFLEKNHNPPLQVKWLFPKYSFRYNNILEILQIKSTR